MRRFEYRDGDLRVGLSGKSAAGWADRFSVKKGTFSGLSSEQSQRKQSRPQACSLNWEPSFTWSFWAICLDYLAWKGASGRKHEETRGCNCFFVIAVRRRRRDSVLGSRETLYCLALVIALTLAGCQATGGENAGDRQGSWWNWGEKTAPPTTTSGSPFSAAATYNRNNNPSNMGLTLYDSTSHDKPAPPPANPTAPAPCASAPPPAAPGFAYPPNPPIYVNVAPGAVPGGNAVPGVVGSAPTGYWIYQPANGYPAPYQNGVPLCIPVYGPPANGYPGPGPAMANGNLPTPPNLSGSPVPAGAYPMNSPPNYPAMAPANVPVNLPPPNGYAPTQVPPSFDPSHSASLPYSPTVSPR